MKTQVICLVLLFVGFAHGQISSMLNQFNPIKENLFESQMRNDKSVNSGTTESNLENDGRNSTNDQNRPDNNQQQNNGLQQSNMGKAGNAVKETIQENNNALKNSMGSMINVGKAHVNAAKDMTETGIKFGTTIPRFGSKFIGMGDNGQKNGGFGFFK